MLYSGVDATSPFLLSIPSVMDGAVVWRYRVTVNLLQTVVLHLWTLEMYKTNNNVPCCTCRQFRSKFWFKVT